MSKKRIMLIKVFLKFSSLQYVHISFYMFGVIFFHLTICYAIFLQDLKCDVPVNVRTFIEDERKKSNGNVCCRIATINLQSDDDVIRSDQNAELEASFETRVCNQRSGYR